MTSALEKSALEELPAMSNEKLFGLVPSPSPLRSKETSVTPTSLRSDTHHTLSNRSKMLSGEVNT